MEKGAKVREKIQETFSGIELIKSFAKEKKEAVKIKNSMRKLLELEIIQNLFSSFSGQTLGIISGINLLAILWFSGYEIISGRLTVGQYFAFVAYVGYLYGPVQLFATIYLGFQKTLVASKRISDFFHKVTEDENPRRIVKLSELKGEIKLKNVCYNYNNGNDVLKNVSITIKKGEKVAIVGASGAGKSTLINLILGLYEPTKGNIFIDNIDSTVIKLESLRNKIGIVSQNIFLFNDSILNNIKYSKPNASLSEVINAAKASFAHEFIINSPNGYNTNAGEIGRKLSGGEKQRISIARTILKNPDIVIFDEPTAHLDSISAKHMYESLKKLFKDKTCIIISHRLTNISWVDNIFVLDEGKIIQEGKHENLINNKGRYQELLKGN